MTNYNINSFGSGLIGKVAQKIDNNSCEGKEGFLDGQEISLFSNELNKKGITFDFSKIKDSSYMNNVEKQYQKSLDNVFEQNIRGQKVIEENKENYTIKKVYNQNLDGTFTACYEITAKTDRSLSRLKNDLGIPDGIINKCNPGYDQYDNNGGYIENKPMKDVTIKIPADKLGASKDLSEIFTDALKSLKFW